MNSNNDPIFLKLCRLCAQEQSGNLQLVNIFSQSGARLNVVSKINNHLPIKVEECDGLPQQACIVCLSKLNVCDNLLKTCIEADKKLQALKNKPITIINLQDNEETSNSALSDFSTDFIDFDFADLSAFNDDIEKITLLTFDNEIIKDSSLEENPPEEVNKYHLSDIISGTCQIGIVIAELKDEDSTPILYLLLMKTSDNYDVSVASEEIKKAVECFKNRDTNESELNKSGNVQCAACNVDFEDINKMKLHLEHEHPDAMLVCPLCKKLVSGTKIEYDKHASICHNNETKKSKNRSVQKSSTSNSEFLKFSGFEVFPLGEANSNLSGVLASKQKAQIIKVARRVKSVEPELKLNLISELRIFLEKFQIEKEDSKVDINKFTCNICNKVCGKNLQRHLKQVHKPCIVKPRKMHLSNRECISCCHCEKLVPIESEANHIESEHGCGTKLLCRICDEILKVTGEIQPHMMVKSLNQYKCPHLPCNRGFKKEKNLIQHIQTVHENNKNLYSEESFLCDYCGKTLLSKLCLKLHIQKCNIVSMKTLGTFKCKICAKDFSLKRCLIYHMSEKHYNQVTCKICGKQFSKRTMKKHILIHGEAQYPCKYCGKRLTTQYNRYYHEKQIHEGVKAAKCPICFAHFRTQQQMEKHKAKKHKEGDNIVYPSYVLPFQCDICQQILSSKASLQSHIYVHLGMKPFPCKKCSMSFRTKSVLKHHEKETCIKSVTFKCQYCCKLLHSKVSLQNHEAYHEGEKRYPCHLCNKIYCHFSSRHKHLRTFHGVARATKTPLKLIY